MILLLYRICSMVYSTVMLKEYFSPLDVHTHRTKEKSTVQLISKYVFIVHKQTVHPIVRIIRLTSNKLC